MNRKLTAMFFLSLLIVAFLATTVTFGAEKPLKQFEDRATIPARFAPTYSFPGLTGSESSALPQPPVRNLRGTKAGEGIVVTIGTTTYGYQHNCTMGRQAEHRAMYSSTDPVHGHYVHFDWMSQTSATLGDGRGVGYQAYEIATCDLVFASGGLRIESEYAGYVTMDAHGPDAMNSWGVPCAHQVEGEPYKSRAYWDFQMGGPVFGVFTDDKSDDYCGHYLPDCTGQNIWPKVSWDVDGAEYVLHMVTSEFGGSAGDPQTNSYYRRVGPYGTGNGVWSDQHVIDTVMNINVDVCSSPISDRVAIVWNAPADYKRDTPDEFSNQLENDVWYAICTDNGAVWGAETTDLGNPSIGHLVDIGTYDGGKVKTYDPTDDYKAYCDMSSLFALTTDAPNDELHVVWGCRRWDDTSAVYRRRSAIFHWRESTGDIKSVVKADWDTGGACYNHAWGGDVAKMTITECEGRLYVCYSQFGDAEHPCHWFDADNQVVSGYLYITVYDPIYGAWDRPQRVTSIPENPTNCAPPSDTLANDGTCNSEYWASMARYGRFDTCKISPPGSVLDIVYVNDLAPGGVVQTESGVWTTNPVNWAVYPCREAVPEPLYGDDAGAGYGLCVNQPIVVCSTSATIKDTLTIENTGTLAMNVSDISATVDSGSAGFSGNTTVIVNPTSGSVPAGGGTMEVEITVTTTGETNNITVYASIEVTHTASNVPSPRVIPMCITVSDEYFDLESAIIATQCKRLRIYNQGQMSNNASNASMDFMDHVEPPDCANLYLYDGSPIICRDDAGQKRCYFTIFDGSYSSDHALRPMSPMFVDSLTNESYTYATAEFITGDSAIGMIVEYFAPKHEDSCSFIIEKLKIFNRTEITITGVAAGEALDWDIPSFEHASNNESGTDPSRNLIYQQCYCPDQGHRDPCDTLLDCQRFGGIAAYEGNPFKNYMTLENDVYVYESGPFGNDAPLPDDTIYALMTGVDGFSTAVIDSCEDLMTLVTFDVYDLEPGDTICVVKILTTSRVDAGAAILMENVDKANTFINAHEEIKCPEPQGVCFLDPLDPDYLLPGDANNDEQVNVGDAVKIINFVFKGGDPPEPYPAASGDANGDCQTNVGDAVKIINFVFKGGDPPVTCEEDVAACGEPPFGP